MGVLSTKILSYSPEVYYPFNDNPFPTTNILNHLGSQANQSWSRTGGTPIPNPTGGPDESGSLQWPWTTAEIILSETSATDTKITPLQDGNFSLGFWFKIPDYGSVSLGEDSRFFFINDTTSNGDVGGFRVAFVSSTSNVNNGKLLFEPGTAAQFTAFYTTERYDDNQWHYLAFRAVLQEDQITVSQEIFLDGQLLSSYSNPIRNLTNETLGFGDNFIGVNGLSPLEFSHFYIAPASSIDSNAISEIWTTIFPAESSNVSVLADALTASIDTAESSTSGSANIDALAFTIDPIGIEPTIVTTTSDSVNIVTSISVIASMSNPISSLSNTVDILDTLDASALSVDPVFGASSPVEITETAIEVSAILPTDILIISDNQVAISATAYEVSATIVNASVVSDDEAIIYADIMAASSEFPLPDFGAVVPDPLYWTAGTLQSKIATYAIESGTEFNWSGSYTTIPSYGTSPSGWSSYNPATGAPAGAYAARYNSSDGPYASGTGCWELHTSARMSSTLQTSITADLNYGLGIWFKVKALPTGTANEGARLFTLGTSTVSATSLDFSVSVTGASHATQPSKLAISLNGTSYDYLTTTLNNTDWYYLAVRRTGSAGVNNFEVYINGELKLVKTNSDTSTTYNRFHIGNNSVASTGELAFQNFHIATAATLTSYEIDQIWLAGTLFPPAEPVNAVHSADRFLATALATSPTIVAVKGDHVEVTTSVTVSSLFPEPSWATGDVVRINAGSLGTVEADFADNVQIETNGDKAITPEPHIANAILVEPIVSRQPAYGYASLPTPQVYTAPNYFALVMNHNPVFYIEDGQPEPVNYGSWEIDGWETEYVDTVQSGLEMNAVGNQKSWVGNSNGIVLFEPNLQANVPDYRTKINDLYATRDLSIEVWYTSVGRGSTVNRLDYIESGPIFNDGITQITEVWDWFGCVPGSDPQLKIMLIGEKLKNYEFSGPTDFATWRSFPDANPKKDQWNHLVVTYEPVTNPQQVRRKIYLNAGIISNQLLTIGNSSINPSGEDFEDEGYIDLSLDQPQNIFQGPILGGGIQLSGSQEIKWEDGVKKDEFAIYPKALSGTQVTEHYNFIKSLSPDATYNSTATDFLVEIGNHQVLPEQNTVYEEDPMPALAARIPEPVIVGGKSKNLSFDSAESSAEIIDASIQTESILSVDAMLATGEIILPSISNNLYYQYVQANIAPYRYVSFDTSNESEDHGTDSDYSVEATTVYGDITEYKDGINNKSVITFGGSYEDGVILNESEWDDSWGTGQNSYHSSFWFQRADDDQSTTGLRVLWNLNGYKDNQHVVLYQYQNKLKIQFNNGLGTWVDAESSTLDLFDYERHFVLIEFDHSNANNNIVKVYVDAVLRITVNLGSYTGSTTNASSADSGANEELNNHPRLGVGCLITPFAATALPVVPTSTKLIVDEIYWDKNSITQTNVTNLYNAMPVKTKYRNYATALTATALIVEPSISTGTTSSAESMLAFPAQTEPSISTEFSIRFTTDSADATADINEAERSDSVNIVSDLFLATFALGFAGAPRIINATPLTASLTLVNRTVTGVQTGLGNAILINGQRTFDPNSKWVQYLLTTTENTLIPMREVR